MGQIRVYHAIVEYLKQHGYPPTVREIQEMTGVKSVSTVHCQIRKLLEEGLLETDAEDGKASRAIRVPGYTYDAIRETILFDIVEQLLKTEKLTNDEIAEICFVTKEKVNEIQKIIEEMPFS